MLYTCVIDNGPNYFTVGRCEKHGSAVDSALTLHHSGVVYTVLDVVIAFFVEAFVYSIIIPF